MVKDVTCTFFLQRGIACRLELSLPKKASAIRRQRTGTMIRTDEPTEGYYEMRFVRGGPIVGIRIWFGAPLEPWTRDVMDRVWRWNAEANGEHVELDRVWPQCVGDPISEAEYKFRCERTGWAKRNDAYDPLATPRRKTNWDDSSVPTLGE